MAPPGTGNRRQEEPRKQTHHKGDGRGGFSQKQTGQEIQPAKGQQEPRQNTEELLKSHELLEALLPVVSAIETLFEQISLIDLNGDTNFKQQKSALLNRINSINTRIGTTDLKVILVLKLEIKKMAFDVQRLVTRLSDDLTSDLNEAQLQAFNKSLSTVANFTSNNEIQAPTPSNPDSIVRQVFSNVRLVNRPQQAPATPVLSMLRPEVEKLQQDLEAIDPRNLRDNFSEKITSLEEKFAAAEKESPLVKSTLEEITKTLETEAAEIETIRQGLLAQIEKITKLRQSLKEEDLKSFTLEENERLTLLTKKSQEITSMIVEAQEMYAGMKRKTVDLLESIEAGTASTPVAATVTPATDPAVPPVADPVAAPEPAPAIADPAAAPVVEPATDTTSTALTAAPAEPAVVEGTTSQEGMTTAVQEKIVALQLDKGDITAEEVLDELQKEGLAAKLEDVRDLLELLR